MGLFRWKPRPEEVARVLPVVWEEFFERIELGNSFDLESQPVQFVSHTLPPPPIFKARIAGHDLLKGYITSERENDPEEWLTGQTIRAQLSGTIKVTDGIRKGFTKTYSRESDGAIRKYPGALSDPATQMVRSYAIVSGMTPAMLAGIAWPTSNLEDCGSIAWAHLMMVNRVCEAYCASVGQLGRTTEPEVGWILALRLADWAMWTSDQDLT